MLLGSKWLDSEITIERVRKLAIKASNQINARYNRFIQCQSPINLEQEYSYKTSPKPR